MSPGILTLLCLTTLFILIMTGWFPHLAEELKTQQKTILSMLLLTIVLTESPFLPIQTTLLIHPGFIALIGLFLALINRISEHSLILLSSIFLFIGSILFFLHEMGHVDTAWNDSTFRTTVLILLVMLPICFTKLLVERCFLLLGSMFVVHIWVLVFHYEMLKPLVIGNDEYLDTVWLCLTGLFLFHHFFRLVVEWVRRRRKVNSI
jgi:hypothetical protein